MGTFSSDCVLEIRAISSEWRCYSDVYGTVRRSFTATKFVYSRSMASILALWQLEEEKIIKGSHSS